MDVTDSFYDHEVVIVDDHPLEPSDAEARATAVKEIEHDKRLKLAKGAIDDSPAIVEPIGIGRLIDANPDLRPVLIDGLLRRGETANVIASSKTGKSFLAGGLAWSVAAGNCWLGRDVVQGRVLVIDNELHPETLASRLHRIAMDRQIDVARYRDALDVVSLRGISANIHQLGFRIGEIKPGDYALVVIDALYRMLPEGTSENDNAQMMAIYNRLDHYAKLWNCGIVVVHHSSKGGQGDKAITDVGAGAGAISRAADTHIAIRPHDGEDEGLAVLEAVTRSFKSPDPVCIRFEYPLWQTVEGVKPVVKAASQRRDEKQAKADAEADEQVRELFAKKVGKLVSKATAQRSTGMGAYRIERTLGRAVSAGWLALKKKRKGNQTIWYYVAKEDPPSRVVNGIVLDKFLAQASTAEGGEG